MSWNYILIGWIISRCLSMINLVLRLLMWFLCLPLLQQVYCWLTCCNISIVWQFKGFKYLYLSFARHEFSRNLFFSSNVFVDGESLRENIVTKIGSPLGNFCTKTLYEQFAWKCIRVNESPTMLCWKIICSTVL